jgi:hypothetical protein
VRWTSSGDGSLYIDQPHYAEAFGGVAPQGALAVAGDRLLVPCGRATPACYDRHTGKLLHYRLAENSYHAGGWQATVAGPVFLNGPGLFEVATGSYLGEIGEPAALSADGIAYGCTSTDCRAFDVRGLGSQPTEGVDRRGQKSARLSSWSTSLPRLSTVPLPGIEALAVTALASNVADSLRESAGTRGASAPPSFLYVATADEVLALELLADAH